MEKFQNSPIEMQNWNLSSCFDNTAAQPPYLLPGRRWVKICPKGYFEPDVEFGRDGMIHRKV